MNSWVHKSFCVSALAFSWGPDYQNCTSCVGWVSAEECGPIKKNLGDRVGDRVEDGATVGTLFVLDSALENGR
jgi:hypothetical protein